MESRRHAEEGWLSWEWWEVVCVFVSSFSVYRVSSVRRVRELQPVNERRCVPEIPLFFNPEGNPYPQYPRSTRTPGG